MNIIQKTGVNYSRGRGSHKPIAIVIHIMDGTLTGTDAWFASAKSKVSAHYGVGMQGEVHQYVREEDTAFHAGTVDQPSWKLIQHGVNPNLYTIGIEHEGRDGDHLTGDQMHSSAQLIYDIAARWNIPLDTDHVIPHHSIRFGKTCPGKGVNIQALIDLAKSISQTQEKL